MHPSPLFTKRTVILSCALILLGGLGSLFAAEKVANKDDHGWVATLQYSPVTGVIYTLGNMRDGRGIRVLLGTKSPSRKVFLKGQKIPVKIKNIPLSKNNPERGIYKYQFKDIYVGTTQISQKSTWEFSVQREITALKEIKFDWWETYLNSHLIAGRSFRSVRGKPLIVSKEPLPTGRMFTVLGKGQRFRKMSFDSAIGRIDLTFSIPMGLVDHRKAPWRRHDNAHLLYNQFRLKKGRTLQLNMQVKITPDFEKLNKYRPASAMGKDIYTPKKPIADRHVIMPTPKEIQWSQGRFHLGLKGHLFHSLQNKHIATQAQRFFSSLFQIDLQEKPLGKQWKNCLVLSNGKLPKTFEKELQQLQIKVATLKSPQSYVLRVVDNAILIVGKNEAGVWNGLMTLFQLSRHQVSTDGIAYDKVNIVDYPDFDHRAVYVRIMSDLDLAWSRQYIAAMAELKYNQALLHFSRGIGVRFKAQQGCYDDTKPSISVKEFAKFVRYIQSFNMEVVPVWAAGKTMLPKKHFKKFPELEKLTIKNGKNWDISLDETFNYHKSILDEIIKVTGAKTINLGLDEIYHFALECRQNTGNGALILGNYINKFTDYYAPRGIRTVVYQDMLLNRKYLGNTTVYFPANAHEGSEKALDLLRNRNMLTIENWSYSEIDTYPGFDYFYAKGFKVYGSCWYRYENIMGLSAYTKGRADTFSCTYWAQPSHHRNRMWDPRGFRVLNGRFQTYKFLPAIGLGGEVAWNAGNRNLSYNFLEQTLLLFNQRKGLVLDDKNGHLFDLSQWANQNIASGKNLGVFNQKNTLSSFPSGKQVLGGVPFLIAKNNQSQALAVSVKGAYTTTLPEQVRIPLKKGKYASLVFLHTCHFDFNDSNMHQDLDTQYIITYDDGSTQKIKLVNDDNIMAWAPALTRFDPANDNLWLAWTGTTDSNLPASVYGYRWENPQPQKIITSVQLQSGRNTKASVYLLGLTGIH